MKLLMNQRVEYNSSTGRYSHIPWYFGKSSCGGRITSYYVFDSGGVPLNMGIAYMDWSMAAYVLYPKPLHLIVRFLHYCSKSYWTFCRLLYKCRFIDIPKAEAFSWRHHFRWCFWKPLTNAR